MKILFFSPHAYFTVHALPEAIVAEALRQDGHEIIMATCDGIYSKNCLCMSGVGFDDKVRKGLVCRVCKSNRDAISTDFRIRTLGVEAYVSQADTDRAEKLTSSLDRFKFLNFEWNEIPVARFAMYEFLLNHKLSSVDIDTCLWHEYLTAFENTLKTLFAIQRIIDEIKPDRIVIYNSLYSINRVVAAVADTKSVPHFSLHAGRHHKWRLQKITIFKGIGYEVILNRLPELEVYRAAPCNKAQIDTVTEHVRELFEANSWWVYTIKSAAVSSRLLLERFGVKGGQKVLLAVMRSGDERNAARYAGVANIDGEPLFANQYEWLSWLIEFSKDHPEYVIIFRVHPREFPNKREAITSQNAYNILSFIENYKFPHNFHINLPKDNLSLHDLLKITDVLLNNTSTAGLEACLFGIPVVGIHDKLCAFDPALQQEPDSFEDYVDKIEAACQSGWKFSRVLGAYRWLNYLFSETEIDISDCYYPERRPITHRDRLLQLIKQKMWKSLNLRGSFNEIRGGASTVRNKDKLVHAIINNQDSHIGIFPMKPAGKPCEEMEGVKEAYKLIMESITDPDDAIFLARVDACLATGLINDVINEVAQD